MIYITNSPKYSIERYLSDDIQACFGFVSMPVFVIELLNNFLYQPKLVEIAMAWEKGELKTFRKYIFRQSTMLLILTGICELGAYFLGIPVLSAVYAVDLTSYKWILLLLLLGGGGLAFVGFFAVLLTVMRKQHWMMICYIIVAAAALFLMPYSVSNSGVWGGTIVFLMLMFSLAFLLFLAVGLNYKCRIWGERKK